MTVKSQGLVLKRKRGSFVTACELGISSEPSLRKTTSDVRWCRLAAIQFWGRKVSCARGTEEAARRIVARELDVGAKQVDVRKKRWWRGKCSHCR